MPERLVTKQFIKQVLELDKERRRRFESKAARLMGDARACRSEKLAGHIGAGASAYSHRFDKGWRFICTDELAPDILFRAVGPHDTMYDQVLHQMPRVTVQTHGIEPLSALLDRCRAYLHRGPRKKRAAEECAADTTDHSVTWEPEDKPPAREAELTHVSESPVESATLLPALPGADQDLLRIYSASDDAFETLLAGNIANWMLFLAPEQRHFVERTFSGPARLVGPAGSGKSAVLLHRAQREAERHSAVLVVCFNAVLRQVTADLLDRLCGRDSPLRKRIEVVTLDRLASEVAGVHGSDCKHFLQRALATADVSRLTLHFESRQLLQFLQSELAYSIKGQVDFDQEAYLSTRFAGKLKLQKEDWSEVLGVWRHYEKLKGDHADLEDVRALALARAGSSFYCDMPAILVDEYQDLSPTALQLLMALSGKARNIFFCGDEQQRLYSRKFSFASLGIQIRGNAVKLPSVQRTTLQIAMFAQTLLPTALDSAEAEVTVSLAEIILPDREGPEPVLAGFNDRSRTREAEWVSGKVQQLIQAGFAAGDVLVLAPVTAQRDHLLRALAERGVDGFVLSRESASHFFDEAAVKVCTMHQAKGLEAKVVFVTGLDGEAFSQEVRYQGDLGRKQISSLLHVACTRARDLLFVSFSGLPLRVLCQADASLTQRFGDTDMLLAAAQARSHSSTPFDQLQLGR